MPGDPRGRALGQSQHGTWDIQSRRWNNGFAAFNDDPAELGHSYEHLEKQAIREGITNQQNEILSLRDELAAEKQARADDKRQAELWSAGRAALGLLASIPTKTLAAPERPKSLLQEAREERAAGRPRPPPSGKCGSGTVCAGR
jgi:hypothetical protein